MFRWYEEAELCITYLADVHPSSDVEAIKASFASSRWFSRGWTLQELLAPRHLVFFTSDWSKAGSRHELSDLVSSITGIRRRYLVAYDAPKTKPLSEDPSAEIMRQAMSESLGFHSQHNPRKSRRYQLMKQASIAERMSWAANRTTTREEDTAYCLLGIFGINMPLLYGEGRHAFIRLQEEIVRNPRVFDPSILAWNVVVSNAQLKPIRHPQRAAWLSAIRVLFHFDHPWRIGQPERNRDISIVALLAPDPVSFKRCGNITYATNDVQRSLTALGLGITLPISTHRSPYMVLPCYDSNHPQNFLAIPLAPHGEGVYARVGRSATWVNHRVWQIWEQRRIDLMTHNTTGRIIALRQREEHNCFIQIRKPQRPVNLIGIHTADGWFHDLDNIRISFNIRSRMGHKKIYAAVVILELENSGATFAVYLEPWRSPLLWQPILSSVRLSSFYALGGSSSNVTGDFSYPRSAERMPNYLWINDQFIHTEWTTESIMGKSTIIATISIKPLNSQRIMQHACYVIFNLTIRRHSNALRRAQAMVVSFLKTPLYTLPSVYMWVHVVLAIFRLLPNVEAVFNQYLLWSHILTNARPIEEEFIGKCVLACAASTTAYEELPIVTYFMPSASRIVRLYHFELSVLMGIVLAMGCVFGENIALFYDGYFIVTSFCDALVWMGFLPIASEVYFSNKTGSQFVGTMRFFLVIAEYARKQQMIETLLELLLTVSIFSFLQIVI